MSISYKGYIGTVELSIEDNLITGKLLRIPDSVSYEGKTVSEFIKDFHNAVDNYIGCKEETD